MDYKERPGVGIAGRPHIIPGMYLQGDEVFKNSKIQKDTSTNSSSSGTAVLHNTRMLVLAAPIYMNTRMVVLAAPMLHGGILLYESTRL